MCPTCSHRADRGSLLLLPQPERLYSPRLLSAPHEVREPALDAWGPQPERILSPERNDVAVPDVARDRGHLLRRALQVAVALRALALGLFPAKGAPSVVIHVVLGALFAVALARTRVPAATSARSA